MMIDSGYLFARDDKRLFINTSLGCNSKCRFCYLPKLGMNQMKKKSWQEILDMLEASNYKYSINTLITIGCFSECFDFINKNETIEMIKYFLTQGNQVQLSTKRRITYDDIKDIIPLIKYNGQLIIFVSSSTISEYENYEFETDTLELRFESFDLLKYNIPVVLYLKPVIPKVTVKDIELYKQLIIEKKIKNVVVGSLFTEEVGKEPVHFSNENKLFYHECSDEKKIIEEFSSITKVWRRSTEVAKDLKKQSELIEEVKKEVYELLKKDKSGHGMDHVNRVHNLSLKFAHQENADPFIVSLIALLHEVDDYKLFGEESAKNLSNAIRIMNQVHIENDVQERVLEAIKKVGYKKALKGIRPDSLEGMIVSDADMCDGLGVTGVLRTYDYQKAHNKPFFDRNIFPNDDVNESTYKLIDDSAVCHCFDKLLRLKGMMMTSSGKKEASNRHDIVVSILYHLFEEEDALEWKDYLDQFLKKMFEY